MKIYIVFGQTGEYSDRKEWTVRAYKDKKRAKVLIELATKEALNLHKEAEHNRLMGEPLPNNKYDPFFKTDYTGTTYFYQEVELED